MPLQCKADGNVPALPGRSRYSICNLTPTWCYHNMAAGKTLTGKAPETATTDAAATDPVVSAGTAKYNNLTEGGLFSLQAASRLPLIVLAIDNDAGASLTLVMSSDETVSRAVPTAPFKLGSGEALKAVGGSAGSSVGMLYEIDSLQRW